MQFSRPSEQVLGRAHRHRKGDSSSVLPVLSTRTPPRLPLPFPSPLHPPFPSGSQMPPRHSPEHPDPAPCPIQGPLRCPEGSLRVAGWCVLLGMAIGSPLLTGATQRGGTSYLSPHPLQRADAQSCLPQFPHPSDQGKSACAAPRGLWVSNLGQLRPGRAPGQPARTLAPALCPHACLTSSCSHQASAASCLDGAARRSAGPGSRSGEATRRRPRRHSAPGLEGSNSRAGSATRSAGGQKEGAPVSRT